MTRLRSRFEKQRKSHDESSKTTLVANAATRKGMILQPALHVDSMMATGYLTCSGEDSLPFGDIGRVKVARSQTGMVDARSKSSSSL